MASRSATSSRFPTALHRPTAVAGVLAQVVLALTLAAGSWSSTAFRWPIEPFSIVGTTGDTVATLFNVGLVLTGVLAAAFSAYLWRTWSRPVAALYAVVAASFAGAGIVPGSQNPVVHAAFGAALLIGIWLLLWTAAAVDWRRGHRGAGLGAFALGTAALAIWLPYDLGLQWAQVGYAAAELTAFGSFAAWTVWTTHRTPTEE